MIGQGESFPYRRIVDELRAQIEAGHREPGSRLPSEYELADHYRTSRPTVRRAIAQLKAEGLVVTMQGRATLVRQAPHVRLLLAGASYRRHRAAGLTGFNAQVVEQGQRPEQRLLEVVVVSAADVPDDVVTRMGLDGDSDQVVIRRRLFLVNDQPVALCDSYYPGDMAVGTEIEQPHRIRGGVHRLIEEPDGPINRRIARSVDELIARMPSVGEAEQLALSTGLPVVRVLRTIYDAGDRAVEVQCTLAAANLHEFRYEVSMT